MAGQIRQAGGLRFADPVLDAGVLAVPQLEPTELTGHDTVTGVGQKRRHPHAVAVGEAELSTGTGPLLAQDQPTPDRPGRQLDQPGGLGAPGAVADPATGLDRRHPRVRAG